MTESTLNAEQRRALAMLATAGLDITKVRITD
jgi:hypothetical protein